MKEIVQFSVGDMQGMARAFVDSNMFGVKSVAEALSLLLIAQAEGMHPAKAMQDYHVIQGKPALKADAMLARFQHAGGKVSEWVLTDDKVSAKFSHPAGGDAVIEWTMERARKAELGGKGMWKKYPRQMLRARVISEGVRTVYPGILGGFYTPEEVQDFDNGRETVKPAEIVRQGSAEFKAMGDGFDRPQTHEDAPGSQIDPPDDPEAAALHEKINGKPEPDSSMLLTCGFTAGKKPVRKKVSNMDDGELAKARELAESSIDDPKWGERAKKALSLIEWEEATRVSDAEAADAAADAAARDY